MTNRKAPFEVTIDNDADAAYISMTNRSIAHSHELGGGIIVDVDDMRVVVGIEILGLETKIPFQRLVDEFHVHSDDIDILRTIQPTIGGFLIQFSSDGSSNHKQMQGSLVSAS
ncbi:DUF2283 domain-containing protein [Microbacterium sp. Mu-80]|uniref:DUF2283 domain-containing protein n=1 Tax=Microbacterium bandirmense TaxID=3122050 RepID=A0ABU8L8F9_9MICO